MKIANDVIQLNQDLNFLVYKGTSDKNILFVGSCRTTPIMYYFSVLCPEYNIYCIYVPYWADFQDFPKATIKSVLADTAFIVSETIRNYQFLNTDRSIGSNFFETFDAYQTEIRMSNLELSLYFYDLINIFNRPLEDYDSVFLESRQRLKTSLLKYGYESVDYFITEQFVKTKLFATHNHPCRILSMLVFKKIVSLLGLSTDFDFWTFVSKQNFLEQNSTPITTLDLEKNKFEFNGKFFEKEVLKQKDFLYSPDEKETKIDEKIIEQYLI